MLTNEKRREILETARAVGYKGSILDLFNAARAGQDISQLLQPQNMEVAQTPEQQSQGLRPQHAAGNTNASMAFPDVPPNTPFSTEGMKAPINISKFDEQGHLVQSFKNVPPGIQSLPTGPGKGTVIETPAYKKGGYRVKYQLGGVKKYQGAGFKGPEMLDEVQVTGKAVKKPRIHADPFGNFEGYVDVGEGSFNTGEAENLFLPLNFSGTSFKGVGANNVQFKRPGLLANQATAAFTNQYGYTPKDFRSRALGALTSGFRGKSDYKPSFKDRLSNVVYNKGYKSVYAPGYDYPLTPTSFSNSYYTNPGDSEFNIDYLDLGKGKLDSEWGKEKIDIHDARDMFYRTNPIWQHGLSIDIEPTYSGNIKKSRVSNIDTDSRVFDVATPFTSNLLDYVGSDTYFERLAAGQYADEIDVDRFSTDPKYRSSFANRLVQEKPEFIANQYQSLTDQFKDGVAIRDVRTQGGDLGSWASSGTSPGEGGTSLNINPDLFTKGKTREEVERDVTKTLRHRNVATYEPEFDMSGRMQPDEFDEELKNPYSAVSQARDMLVNAGMDTQNFDWRNTIGHELGHSISMSRLKSLSRDDLSFDNNDPNAYSNDYKFLYGLNNLTSGGNFYSLQDHLDSGETSKTYLQTLDEKLEGQASELDSKYHLVSPEETVGDIHGVRAYNQRVYGINPKEPFTKEQLETLLKDDEFKKSLIYDRMNQRFGEDQSKWMKAMNLIASTEDNTGRATYAKKGGYRFKYQTAGPRLKTYTDYDKFVEHNNAYQDSLALNKYYKAQLEAEERQPDNSSAAYDAQLERLRAGEIDTSKIADLRKLGNQIVQNSDGRLQWSGSGSGSASPDLQYYNVQDDSNANIFQKMYSNATEGKSLLKGANKFWLGNAYNAIWDKPKVKPVFMDESDPYGASKQESIPMSNQPVLYEEEWQPSAVLRGDVHESAAKKHNNLRKKYPKLDSLYTTPSALLRYNDRIMNKLDKIDPETSYFMPSDTTFYDSNLGLVVNAGRYDPKEAAKMDPNDGNPFGVETYIEFSEPSVKKESAVKLTPKSAKLGNYTPLELIPPIPPRIHSRKLNQQTGQYMYDTNFGKFNLDRGDQDANFVRTYRTQIDDLRRNRAKYQFGGREGEAFQEVDTYIKPGQSTRPNWAQTPYAVTNYTFGKNLVDDESRFSLGLQGTDILDEIKYRADLIGSAGIGVGNRKGKSFRPAGENLRAGIRGQASWQGVPGNVLENMFPRSGVNVRGSFEGEAGLAYGNGAVSPYMSVTPQTNFSLNDNLSLGVGYEMRGRYDKNRNNPIYGSTGTGTVAPLSQRDAYSGMGRGAGRLSLKYDMGDGDFIEGYYSKPNSLYQGSMYPVPGVIALENEGPRFGVRLKKSF